MTDEEIKQEIINKTKEVYNAARTLYPSYLRRFPTITFTDKPVDAMGRAYGFKNRLHFAFLYYKVDKAAMMDTVAHEMAHLVNYNVYSKGGHGRQWRHVCACLGGIPERCHNVSIDHLKKEKHIETYPYNCECKTHFVSKRIHQKMLNGQKRYCQRCKAFIVFVENKEKQIA